MRDAPTPIADFAGPRRYGIQAARRRPLLDFMLASLERSGCRILGCAPPDTAPFVFSFETPERERLGVVAYAFTATRTPTKGRPPDERSFQIKYGSQTDGARNVHHLWRDPAALYTTILVGIDPDGGFFVSADPSAHSPTKFFIRLEFKDEHVEAIRNGGWHSWERDRRASAEPIEVLVGGTSDRFLDLVLFERAAAGLSPGDRQLLSERPAMFARVTSDDVADAEQATLHPLVTEFELPPERILELIASARRLKMAVRGWVAEEKLRSVLAATEGVTRCERLDVEGGADLLIRWRDGPPISIECKNTLRKRTADGLARIDFQRTRAAKGDPCSRYYRPSDFDVVAGCLHAVTEKWEFAYILPATLPPHGKCAGRIANNVKVGTAWTADAGTVFEAAYAAAKGRK